MASASDPPAAPFVVTLVTDRRLLPVGGLLTLLKAAAAAGVQRIQIREKDLSDRALAALVREVLQAVGGTSTRVLVNGRPDVAAAMGAAGVQLPERGLPVADVRRAFPSLELGVSCHSLQAAVRAEADGADFVLLGPIFASPGKKDRSLGTSALEAVARRVGIPVHAIGGIGPDNVREARGAGAQGAAAIRAFLDLPVDRILLSLRTP